MDYHRAMQEVEKSIQEAIASGAAAIIPGLKAEKDMYEKQVQLANLRDDLYRQSQRAMDENKPIITQYERLFEDWFHEMTTIENKLKIAFESKTGEAIGEKLMQERNRLCRDYGQVYREVIQSCKGNHW
ncbi:hypothetical protein HCI99_04355 [Listeria booriae]|uniref:Uncharacterized protein n=1 Tax=Listeria booriae TaxID=1552123 RepID=A0A7X0XBA9_9LIST|nr:hypothetical protein [Listeria booriae]MBC1491036.1 hypothetical protein [Listeria booriae]MBC1491049.1 hypothetical protein [Listeria booriae]MBC6151119.1 hypothetical protein [Listeria booriae]MBC6151132.1 hypothetical protein [Listeria booriae]